MLYSAIILGFLGSFHCVGMCGPIAFVLPLDRSSQTKMAVQVLVYHLGRLLSYSFLGFLFGMLGRGLYLSGLQQNLSIIIGCLMIVYVLIPSQYLKKIKFSNPVFRMIFSIKSSMAGLLKKKDTKALFSFGILNGLLPCGLIYIALFGATAIGSPVSSALYMFLFGLGTVPLMSGAAYLGAFISVQARRKIQRLIPISLIIIGSFFIIRGLGLDIPYLSPSTIHLMVKPNPECIVP